MPDVFIPYDTTRYTDYHRQISALGLISRLSINYLDVNRQRLNNLYPAFDSYQTDFEVTEELLQELVNLASEEKVEFDEEQYNRSKPLISLHLKALIARDLYDMNEYFRIINEDNASLKEALRIINDLEAYNKILSGPGPATI